MNKIDDKTISMVEKHLIKLGLAPKPVIDENKDYNQIFAKRFEKRLKKKSKKSLKLKKNFGFSKLTDLFPESSETGVEAKIRPKRVKRLRKWIKNKKKLSKRTWHLNSSTDEQYVTGIRHKIHKNLEKRYRRINKRNLTKNTKNTKIDVKSKLNLHKVENPSDTDGIEKIDIKQLLDFNKKINNSNLEKINTKTITYLDDNNKQDTKKNPKKSLEDIFDILKGKEKRKSKKTLLSKNKKKLKTKKKIKKKYMLFFEPSMYPNKKKIKNKKKNIRLNYRRMLKKFRGGIAPGFKKENTVKSVYGLKKFRTNLENLIKKNSFKNSDLRWHPVFRNLFWDGNESAKKKSKKFRNKVDDIAYRSKKSLGIKKKKIQEKIDEHMIEYLPEIH